jgi:hypothetical protein
LGTRASVIVTWVNSAVKIPIKEYADLFIFPAGTGYSGNFLLYRIRKIRSGCPQGRRHRLCFGTSLHFGLFRLYTEPPRGDGSRSQLFPDSETPVTPVSPLNFALVIGISLVFLLFVILIVVAARREQRRRKNG